MVDDKHIPREGLAYIDVFGGCKCKGEAESGERGVALARMWVSSGIAQNYLVRGALVGVGGHSKRGWAFAALHGLTWNPKPGVQGCGEVYESFPSHVYIGTASVGYEDSSFN